MQTLVSSPLVVRPFSVVWWTLAFDGSSPGPSSSPPGPPGPPAVSQPVRIESGVRSALIRSRGCSPLAMDHEVLRLSQPRGPTTI